MCKKNLGAFITEILNKKELKIKNATLHIQLVPLQIVGHKA
jgi:hypothetical protein